MAHSKIIFSGLIRRLPGGRIVFSMFNTDTGEKKKSFRKNPARAMTVCLASCDMRARLYTPSPPPTLDGMKAKWIVPGAVVVAAALAIN